MSDRSTGLKLDEQLYQLVSDVIQLTGESFKELVSRAIDREIQLRLKKDKGRLKAALDAMRAFREDNPSSTPSRTETQAEQAMS